MRLLESYVWGPAAVLHRHAAMASLHGARWHALSVGDYGQMVHVGLLRAARRMALTNYVGQGVFFLLVFDGFGAGLILRAGPAVDLALAVVLVTGQIAQSVWWLRGFRFGPLEWLWRSATYGTWPPLRATR